MADHKLDTTQALLLAPMLHLWGNEIIEALESQTNIPLRTDHAPVRVPLHGSAAALVRVAITGWNKLNFERIRFIRFDADEGMIETTSDYEIIENVNPAPVVAEADTTTVAPEENQSDTSECYSDEDLPIAVSSLMPVLTRWQRRPSWTVQTTRPVPLLFLEWLNRSDRYGKRSANLSITLGQQNELAKLTKKTPVFRMNDRKFVRQWAPAALEEVVNVSEGLVRYLNSGVESWNHAVSIALKPVDSVALARDLVSHDRSNKQTTALVLRQLAWAAASVLCHELQTRIPANRWEFGIPVGCRRVRLQTDMVAGAFTAEAGLPVTLQLKTPAGFKEVSFHFGGGIPHLEGVHFIAERPTLPDFPHTWTIEALTGYEIVLIRLGNEAASGFPYKATQLRVIDITRPNRPFEINPLSACLGLLKQIGKLSADNPAVEPHSICLPAYCLGWRLFMANQFTTLRSAWQAKLISGLRFSDLSAPLQDFNRALDQKYHRILSKHGFQKPLYARNIPQILNQISYIESVVKEHFDKTLFVAYGTLLGCVRDKGFIPHDDDIDLAVIIDALDFDDMLEKRAGMIKQLSSVKKIRVSDPYGAKGRVVFSAWVSGFGQAINLDMFPIWRLPDGSVHGMMERLKIRQFGGDWFKSFRRENFYSGQVWIPEQTEEFMLDRYGPGWITPDPSYGLG